MYIIHTIPRFPYIGGDAVVGGAASSLWNLAREQAKKHRVTILGNLPHEQATQRLPVRLRHLHVGPRPSSTAFGIEYSLKAACALAQYSQVDIVQSHSGFSEYSIATLSMRLRRNVPAIHTFYCPLPNYGIRSLMNYALVRFADRIGGIARFVAISQNVARSLQKAGVRSFRIEIVPPVVDIDRFSQVIGRENIRARLDIAQGAPVILFVGNWKRAKNLERALEALGILLADFPDVMLIITTELWYSSDNDRVKFLSKLVEQWSLESHIRWVGLTEEMPHLMAASDVLVAPFLHTNGPSDYFIAALEAMAAGIPVVASAVGGMLEVVDPSRGRLVNPLDSQDIAKAIAELLQDEGKRRLLGDQAQRYVKSTFSPKKIAGRMQSIYSEVVNA